MKIKIERIIIVVLLAVCGIMYFTRPEESNNEVYLRKLKQQNELIKELTKNLNNYEVEIKELRYEIYKVDSVYTDIDKSELRDRTRELFKRYGVGRK